MAKQKQTEESWEIILWTLIIFGTLIGVLMFFALYSTSNYIGLGSALQLSVCHFMLTDEQCIGSAKAGIIADLQNDGRDTHGVQIFYGNQKRDIPNHEIPRELMDTYHLSADVYTHKYSGGSFFSSQP